MAPGSVQQAARAAFGLLAHLCFPLLIHAQTFSVSTAGNDAWPGTPLQPWRTVQKACSSATPGSTVIIRGGVYTEKVTVTVSGDALNGFITFRNAEGESAILDGTGVEGENMLFLSGRSYLRFAGLTLRNNSGVTDGGGVRIVGAANHIELRGLIIHGMHGQNAMGITCYGTDPAPSITNLVIDSCTIYDCQAAPSEALTLNGNVDGFAVTANTVHDINNIGIDFIGGEGVCPVAARDRARNGVCRWNHVYRARSVYGGGYGAGIYVDGGSRITVENNILHENDLGIEIGCENHGRVADSIIVRNNLVYANDKRGISFGGYNYPATGLVRDCDFVNNTLFHNDVLSTGDGEILVEYALNCRVRNTIAVATGQSIILFSNVGSAAGNLFDNNLFFAPAGSGGARFGWGAEMYTGFAAYRAASGQDAASLFSDPRLVAPILPAPDLHILPGSPAVDAGWPGTAPDPFQRDMDGDPRLIGLRVDIGADELAVAPGAPQLLEPPSGIVDLPPVVTCAWSAVPAASFADLQIAADSLFTLPVFEDSTTTTTMSAGPLPPATRLFWRVRAGNSIGAGPWSAVRDFTTTTFVLDTFALAAGWNLVALPLDVFDPLRNAVYPSSVSPAFAFDPGSGYAPRDTMVRGSGYWLKFPEPGECVIAGRLVAADTIPLQAGWNLVGSVSLPVPAESVSVVPPGALQSPFFGYDGTYVPADTLRPSRAYWVKANSPALLLLHVPSAGRVRQRFPGRPTDWKEP